jgi:hypothetical protein
VKGPYLNNLIFYFLLEDFINFMVVGRGPYSCWLFKICSACADLGLLVLMYLRCSLFRVLEFSYCLSYTGYSTSTACQVIYCTRILLRVVSLFCEVWNSVCRFQCYSIRCVLIHFYYFYNKGAVKCDSDLFFSLLSAMQFWYEMCLFETYRFMRSIISRGNPLFLAKCFMVFSLGKYTHTHT